MLDMKILGSVDASKLDYIIYLKKKHMCIYICVVLARAV